METIRFFKRHGNWSDKTGSVPNHQEQIDKALTDLQDALSAMPDPTLTVVNSLLKTVQLGYSERAMTALQLLESFVGELDAHQYACLCQAVDYEMSWRLEPLKPLTNGNDEN